MGDGHFPLTMTEQIAEIEKLAGEVNRDHLGLSLDWHYCGGRADVLTLEPPERDEQILSELKMAMPVWLSPSVDDLGRRRGGA